MDNPTVHVWRMVSAETANFAAADVLVACQGPDEAEARSRAGWPAASTTAAVSAEYLGEMTYAEFNRRLTTHQSASR